MTGTLRDLFSLYIFITTVLLYYTLPHIASFGAGTENRTPVNGLETRSSTIKLYPQLEESVGFEPTERHKRSAD